jgi:flagellum-specific ATP synthase
MGGVEAKRGIHWRKYSDAVNKCNPIRLEGRIVKVAGILAEARGPGLAIGSLCEIQTPGSRPIAAEVVGFRDNRLILMPYEDIRGVRPDSKIIDIEQRPAVGVGQGYLGRVVDGAGVPIDNKGAIVPEKEYPLSGAALNPLDRPMIDEPLDVGVRPINALLTVGKGQRIGIMAGSGVGKSVLLGMIAKNTAADVVVIALIGERGREVQDFIHHNLGEEGLKKSTVVVATSDSPALVKIRGAYMATALAEYFRDQGLDVLLMMDSVTRYAMSLREIGLAAGEPPSAKGYTPSVFVQLPKLLERAGKIEGKGSITGIYTVLVEGDDMNEPIADAVRSILDGHIVLSRAIAHKGHYPAIDVLGSVSRVMKDIVEPSHRQKAARVVEYLATYREAEDLINIGAYKDGSSPQIDEAKRMIGPLRRFLRQAVDERVDFAQSLASLDQILGR